MQAKQQQTKTRAKNAAWQTVKKIDICRRYGSGGKVTILLIEMNRTFFRRNPRKKCGIANGQNSRHMPMLWVGGEGYDFINRVESHIFRTV
jgi:hypothetical protein